MLAFGERGLGLLVPQLIVGLAAARNTRGGYAFIDPLGAIVIPPRFDEVDRFRHGLCRVAASDTLGYIGRDGAWIWRQRFKGYHKRSGG